MAAVYLGVSAISFGVSRLVFAGSGSSLSSLVGGNVENLIQPVIPKSGSGLKVDTSLPKDQECPINGEKFTLPEKEAWEKKRPLFVMIENHMDARPQSGLGSADIVYEAVVEGGITRFMAGYYCGAQATDSIVAPVRSARQLFIDYASEYNFPLYAHVGGANGLDTDPRVRAIEHLSDYGWTGANDLNQFSIGYPVFVRNYDRVPGKELATEHTMESSTERLWTYAATKRGLTNLDKKGVSWTKTFTPWTFVDEASSDKRGVAQTIAHDFWTDYKQFAVQWAYDPVSNTYFRSLAGEKHVDMNDQKQLIAKNVVILSVKENASVDIHKHTYYQTIGTGNAIVFQNGQRIDATWSKKDRLSRLKIVDKKGKEISFVRGKIWISILPTTTSVSVQ